MARVNHKLVRQRLNEKKSKITDRQFFTSRCLAGHFEDLAVAQTRRYSYNRRVRVKLYWEPQDENAACTDNSIITINAGNKLVKQIKGRTNRYQLVLGLFAHELGHVLYTDFLALQTSKNYFENNRWYPYALVYTSASDITNEKDMWEYVKQDEKNREAVIMLLHNLINILEDGYIENRIMNEFPGTLGQGLKSFRDVHFKSIKTVTELKEEEEDGKRHIIDSITQVLLSYAKFGEIKYGDEPYSDVRIKTTFDMLSEIDEALASNSIKDRIGLANLLLVRSWQYFKDFIEICKQNASEEESGNGKSSAAGAISKRFGSLAGSSSIGSGNSTPVKNDGSSSSVGNSAKRAATKSDAASSDNDKETENESESNKSGSTEESENAENKTESEDTGVDEQQSEDDTAQEIGQNFSPPKKEVKSEEGGRIPLHNTETVSEPVGGNEEYNEEYEREQYDRAASDIERLLENMAEKAATEELENERLSELNDMAQSISYGDAHKGVGIRVNRISSVDDELIEQYNQVSAPLIAISRILQRNLLKQLKDIRLGGKMTGLLMGRCLDARALHRNDGKIFSKNRLPQETPQLAVGLLLDESWSMSYGERATYARAAAIILHDFCDSLDIPITIYGHSTPNGKAGLELYSYAEFDSIDNDDKYRLMDISARNSNRDGAALRYVAEKLSKREENVKLLILVSDGQPADYGYSGTAAEEDLRGIKQEYKRKGITFVAAAIGSDKANIERIYGDSFLDITDLTQLPVKLTAIVKKHIRI